MVGDSSAKRRRRRRHFPHFQAPPRDWTPDMQMKITDPFTLASVGDDVSKARTRQTGLAQAGRGRSEYRGKALLQAEAEVCRPGRLFAENVAGEGAQARAAACAAAVNAE